MVKRNLGAFCFKIDMGFLSFEVLDSELDGDGMLTPYKLIGGGMKSALEFFLEGIMRPRVPD